MMVLQLRRKFKVLSYNAENTYCVSDRVIIIVEPIQPY